MQRTLRISATLMLLALLLAACRTGTESDPDAAGNAEAFIGDLAANVTASGKLLPARAAVLTLAGGRVEAVPVSAGERVEAGDLLVLLETTDLALAAEAAEQDLALAEVNLRALQAPPLAEEVAAAEAAVASAHAQLRMLRAGARAEEVAVAEANLRAAQAGLWGAAEQRDASQVGAGEAATAAARAAVAAAEQQLTAAERARELLPGEAADEAVQEAQQALTLAQAELDALLAGPSEDALGAAEAGVWAAAARRDAREAELARLESGAGDAEIAAAQATLAQARAALAALEDGPSEAEIDSAEAQVEQARLALADARAALEDAALRAPFSGIVSAVHVAEGEVAGGPAVELLDPSSLRVVLSVDEADIGRLEAGQPARVTLEPWPERALEGVITRIAPAATAGPQSALVSYEVTLTLEESELPLRAGLTADARLLTAAREGVLLLPNRAIIADRQAGRYYVELLRGADGGTERVEVEIGLRDDENTEILGGLEAGDRVLIPNALPVYDFSGPPDDDD
ncbi:MAG: efflux RND transporter periplasmic adaptor subunit [Candidatus Promineifilaceae bacterium]|nr:efflux RND transporter periplasmic adaptor subunit [Candidatus Promineifilaceae bacterium]